MQQRNMHPQDARISLFAEKLGRKIIAYRNDFCLTCQAPCRAYQISRVLFLRLHFIPIPVGLWRSWYCSVCMQNPHSIPGRFEELKRVMLIVLATVSFFGWIAPDTNNGVWWMRIAPLVAITLILLLMAKRWAALGLQAKLSQIPPDAGSSCPLCRAPIIMDNDWRCSACGLKRASVSAPLPVLTLAGPHLRPTAGRGSQRDLVWATHHEPLS